jgi:hypothetical protein
MWIEATSNLSAADMPRESFLLFAVWCCLKVELDDVMFGLSKFQRAPTRTEELKTYKTLLRMRSALTREFGQLSSKLRLTPPAARLDAHRSQSGVSNKPWSVSNKPSASTNKQEGQQPREFSQLSSKLEAQPRNGKLWGESEVASEEQQ